MAAISNCERSDFMRLSLAVMISSLLFSVAAQPIFSAQAGNDSSSSYHENVVLIEEETKQMPKKSVLEVQDFAKRQEYHLDRAEACRYIMDTYEILTEKQIDFITDNPFSDIDTNSQQFVLQAYSLGIVSGKEDGSFSPSEGLSRGDFAIMLYGLIQTVYPEADLSGGENIVFEEHIANTALVPLQFAYSRGLMDIQSNGMIGADDTISLSEAVNILNTVIKTAPDFTVKYPQYTCKRAFLTFDDGTSQNTEKILDILKQYDVKATFFVTGDCDETLLKRMQQEGHVVGNHTNSHKYDVLYASSDAFWEDFNRQQEYLENVLGTASVFMRFPGGSNNSVGMRNGVMKEITEQANENGYIYVDWNVDSGDAKGNGVSKDTIVYNVLSGVAGKNQAVILMHQTKPKTTTVEALPQIIEGLQAQGYEIRPMTANSYMPRFIK